MLYNVIDPQDDIPYEIETDDHTEYIEMDLETLAFELLANYDEETLAYSIGVSLLSKCGRI